MRLGVADYNGKFVGYDYKTTVVKLDEEMSSQFQKDPKTIPEVIGGEWIVEKEDEETL